MRLKFVLIFFLLCSTQVLANEPAQSKRADQMRIVFLGDSLTAGFGLEDPALAYPSLIGQELKRRGIEAEIVNGGISGDTTAGGLRRVEWLLSKGADVVVVALGANDGLRGVPPEETKKNLNEIFTKLKVLAPNAKLFLAGMLVPPSMGEQYAAQYAAVFPEVAKVNSAKFIPFLLEGVAGQRDLNQADGIHPTSQGHEVMAKYVLGYLLGE